MLPSAVFAKNSCSSLFSRNRDLKFQSLVIEKLGSFPASFQDLVIQTYDSPATSAKVKRILQSLSRPEVRVAILSPETRETLALPTDATTALQNFNSNFTVGNFEDIFDGATMDSSPNDIHVYLDRGVDDHKLLLSMINILARIEFTELMARQIKNIRFPLVLKSAIIEQRIVITKPLIVWSQKLQKTVVDQELYKLLSDRYAYETEAEAFFALPTNSQIQPFISGINQQNYRARIVQHLLFESKEQIKNPDVRKFGLCSLPEIFQGFARSAQYVFVD